MASTITAQIGTTQYQTRISNSRHTIIADESAENGGSDTGPSPTDMLMMSLAGCTAITLRMYIKRKQWDVTNLKVYVNSKKNGTETVFTRNIEIEGTLSDENRQRLLAIANACPVHKTLTNAISIQTEIKTIHL